MSSLTLGRSFIAPEAWPTSNSPSSVSPSSIPSFARPLPRCSMSFSTGAHSSSNLRDSVANLFFRPI